MLHKIGILNIKGGVGKTTLIVNLGHALTEFGREVLLVDADLRRPHLGLILGYEYTPKCAHTAIKGEHDITECSYLHPSGIRILPGSSNEETSYTKPHFDHFFELLDSFNKNVELALIDTPPARHDVLENIIPHLDACIIITTPDPVAIQDAIRTHILVKEKGIHCYGVVINKKGEHDKEQTVAQIEHQLQLPVIGVIPYSKETVEATHHKYPVTYANVNAKASIAFKRLAANLIGETYVADHETEVEKNPVNFILKRVGLKD